MSLPLVLVTQQVQPIADRGERRDALDQRWAMFLRACGLLPLPLPNGGRTIAEYLALPGVRGAILTGGNDLAGFGPPVPERDAVETALIAAALEERFPLIGVCRGMQMIQAAFGTELRAVPGHVAESQTIRIDGRLEVVNSYHRYGAYETPLPLRAWAAADDGVIKAVQHGDAPLLGIMWHPERTAPFAERDISLFQQHFLTQ